MLHLQYSKLSMYACKKNNDILFLNNINILWSFVSDIVGDITNRVQGQSGFDISIIHHLESSVNGSDKWSNSVHGRESGLC